MSDIGKRQLFAFTALLLATAAHAQDGLVGTWEHVIEEEEGVGASALLTIKEDGTAELIAEVQFGPEFVDLFLGDGELDELPDIPFFTEGFSMRFVINGRWEVTDTQFALSEGEVSVTIDGLTVEEFFVGIAQEMAVALAEEQEISEEDFPAFEESVVTLFMLQIDLEEFEEIFSSEFAEDKISEFSLAGDTLILMDEDDFETEYRRVGPVSAVAPTSWGQVKAAGRRTTVRESSDTLARNMVGVAGRSRGSPVRASTSTTPNLPVHSCDHRTHYLMVTDTQFLTGCRPPR